MNRSIELSTLHRADAIYFPIVVNNRHGIARYPVNLDADGGIIKDHQLLEFYYINGINTELVIFNYILDKLDNQPTWRHPVITGINSTQLTPINRNILIKKKIIATCHLSYRADQGVITAYYSAPNRMRVADNIIDRPLLNNIQCGDSFADRFKFIVNMIVNCYA